MYNTGDWDNLNNEAEFPDIMQRKKTYRTYQREFLIKLEGFKVVKMDLLLSSPSLLWLQRQKHQNIIHIPKSLHYLI